MHATSQTALRHPCEVATPPIAHVVAGHQALVLELRLRVNFALVPGRRDRCPPDHRIKSRSASVARSRPLTEEWIRTAWLTGLQTRLHSKICEAHPAIQQLGHRQPQDRTSAGPYRAPPSQSTVTTVCPGPSLRASFTAPTTFSAADGPMYTPSARLRWNAMSTASWSDTGSAPSRFADRKFACNQIARGIRGRLAYSVPRGNGVKAHTMAERHFGPCLEEGSAQSDSVWWRSSVTPSGFRSGADSCHDALHWSLSSRHHVLAHIAIIYTPHTRRGDNAGRESSDTNPLGDARPGRALHKAYLGPEHLLPPRLDRTADESEQARAGRVCEPALHAGIDGFEEARATGDRPARAWPTRRQKKSEHVAARGREGAGSTGG